MKLDGRDPFNWRDILPRQDWGTDRALAQMADQGTATLYPILHPGDTLTVTCTTGERGNVLRCRVPALTLRAESKAFARFGGQPCT